MKEDFYELYNSFEKEAKEKNKKIVSSFNNSNIEFASREIMSLIVSECLMEDVATIGMLKENSCSDRYVDYIIRNMCEQVIEYMYIIKHPKLIKEYFGMNISAEGNENNLFKVLKRTGKARFENRESVAGMAADIGEKKSSEEKISLYEIYSLKAELEHHSYFHHMLDLTCKIDCENESENTEGLEYVFLIYILTAFIEIYDTV